MNQPKSSDSVAQPRFKFGDKLIVKDKEGAHPFTVKAIHQDYGIFFYGEDGFNGRAMWDERVVNLYQEPQKKKLYAWRFNKAPPIQIQFTEDPACYREEYRAPEYDIEYPEATP
jgi:hypothetical protein